MPPPGNLQITGVWAAGLLFGLVLFTYAPAMTAGFIWDDDQYVTQNVQGCDRHAAGLSDAGYVI